jgi:alkyl hydroperoxide reductase subunit AhpC
MVQVGSNAPPFDCSAVVEGTLIDLTWKQIHEEKVLVLLFDSVVAGSELLHGLTVLQNGTTKLERLGIKIFVVGRDPMFETLTSDIALPIIVDTDSRIALLYDMLTADGRIVWGQCITDPRGIVRYLSGCDVPETLNVDELFR